MTAISGRARFEARRLGALVGPGAARATRLDATTIASALALNVLGFALPLVTLHVYDRVLPNQAVETLMMLTIGLIGVALLELALRGLQSAVLAPSAARFGRELRAEALRRVLSGAATPGRGAPTQVLERLGAIDRLTAYYGGAARLALLDLPFAVLALVVIALIGGPVALAPLAALLLYLALLGRYGALLTVCAETRRENDLKSQDFLTETLFSILSVKSLGLERLMLRRYERLLDGAVDAHERTLRINGAAHRVSAMFGNLSIVATMTIGAALAIAGEMTVGGVAAATLLAGRVAQPAIRAAKGWSEVQRARLAVDEVVALFEGAEAPSGPPASAERPAAPAVALADATASSGAMILLEGGDAAARTRFLEAAAGLARATPLRLDGAAPEAFRRRAEAAAVLMRREAAPFQGGVLDNLTLFGDGPSTSSAMAAAAAIGLEEDLRKLPLGYDTPLGGGVTETLPFPVLKKVALARALAQRPPLLLLDEPTAHFDAVSSALAVDAVAALRPGTTLIIASADPRFHALADHRITLAPGEGGRPRLSRITGGADARG